MGLKAFVQSLDDVPEVARDLYTKTGDGFVLDVDDKDYKDKVSEFRDNNIALRRKVDELTGMEGEYKSLKELVEQYKDIGDPEKAKEALAKINDLEEKNLLDAGKLDEVVAQRTDRMRQDFEAQVEALSSKLNKSEETGGLYKQRYSEVVIDSGLQREVAKVASVRPGAMTDIVARGKAVWSVDEDGNPVPRDAQGKIRYGKDGDKPLTMAEWAESLLLEAPYLFEGSAGGGSGGGSGRSNVPAGKVSLHDQQALNSNIERIASGDVEVMG